MSGRVGDLVGRLVGIFKVNLAKKRVASNCAIAVYAIGLAAIAMSAIGLNAIAFCAIGPAAIRFCAIVLNAIAVFLTRTEYSF